MTSELAIIVRDEPGSGGWANKGAMASMPLSLPAFARSGIAPALFLLIGRRRQCVAGLSLASAVIRIAARLLRFVGFGFIGLAVAQVGLLLPNQRAARGRVRHFGKRRKPRRGTDLPEALLRPASGHLTKAALLRYPQATPKQQQAGAGERLKSRTKGKGVQQWPDDGASQ